MDALRRELYKFKTQLRQIQVAISCLPDGTERDNLIILENDIKELIKLSDECPSSKQKRLKEFNKRCDAELGEGHSTEHNDPLANEYKLFQAEVGALVSGEKNEEHSSKNFDDSRTSDVEDLMNDLKAMEGMKCQAPYKYTWTEDVAYHNALIFRIENLNEITDFNNIEVRVMFTNPTHNGMLPCPFYLDGKCKFSDEKCKFSHGEKVYFNSLRDYREPDFGNVADGKFVLAKKTDGLWHRAVVKSVDGDQCVVKFDSNLEEETHLQNILPLVGDDGSDESDSGSEDNSENQKNDPDREEILRRILLAPPSSALGEWEKFTKGAGSRIMEKMGYIHGSGLGKEGTGRVEPVPALILPAGKSLDYCMMLREQSGGDENFFKAERRLKMFKKKQQKMLEKSYKREKERKDVFMFLNKNLGQFERLSQELKKPKNLENESLKSLNVTSLRLAEEARKLEKEMASLKKSLTRYSSRSNEYRILHGKLVERETKLSELRASEQRIANEQELRRERKKLTIF